LNRDLPVRCGRGISTGRNRRYFVLREAHTQSIFRVIVVKRGWSP